jgi:cyanophycin synthetase
VVLAGPGDRRDEDLVAIARAAAGSFDHYICRRDDALRERGPDEVPRIQAAALREAGVPEDAISVIPDEQQAIDAALNMGRQGDLILIFADALVRSWKQITKFKPQGAAARVGESRPTATAPAYGAARGGGNGQLAAATPADGAGQAGQPPEAPAPALSLEGLIRDERGVRFAPDAED